MSLVNLSLALYLLYTHACVCVREISIKFIATSPRISHFAPLLLTDSSALLPRILPVCPNSWILLRKHHSAASRITLLLFLLLLLLSLHTDGVHRCTDSHTFEHLTHGNAHRSDGPEIISCSRMVKLISQKHWNRKNGKNNTRDNNEELYSYKNKTTNYLNDKT